MTPWTITFTYIGGLLAFVLLMLLAQLPHVIAAYWRRHRVQSK